jgi:hypothetical protein
VILYSVVTQASPLISYPVSQLHLAYKLVGTVSHVVTSLPVAKFDVEYHHWNTECPSFLLGVQSDFILFHFTIIVAQVPQFGYIFSIFVFSVSLKQRTRKALLTLK